MAVGKGLAMAMGFGIWSVSQALGQITVSTDTLAFPPTTIDSLVTLSVTVTNDLSVEQQVTWSGLSAPFSTAANPLAVPASGSATASFSFAPVSVNTFANTLVASGSAFGSDTLVLSAEGTLPGAQLLQDTLDFGAVSVNSVATAYVPVASTGIGTLYLSGLTSGHPEIYMDAGVSIPAGDTALVPIRFFSELSGEYAIDVVLHTSDPFNPTLELHCLVSAISEVGGEVCGTWSLVNSPYLLVDDVVVPNGCSLTIQPGVVVLGDGHDIEVFGGFYANGEEGVEVEISVGELLSHTAAENMVLTHAVVTETNEFEFPDVDFRILRDANIFSADSLHFFLQFEGYTFLFENESAGLSIGKYTEDFSDNLAQGWTHDGSWDGVGPVTNEAYRIYFNGCNGCYYSSNIYSPVFTLNEGESWDEVTFNQYTGFETTGYTNYNRNYLRVDGGEWIEIDYESQQSGWRAQSYDLTEFTGETIQFRTYFYWQDYGEQIIDDFTIETNFFSGAPGASTLSTGGIQLNNTNFNGDFHSVGDSLSVSLSNSTIAPPYEREKSSHGLGLFAENVQLITSASTTEGHDLDGIHIESLTTNWVDDGSIIEGNGDCGVEVNGDLNWESESAAVISNEGGGVRVSGSVIWQSASVQLSGNGGAGLHVGNDLDWESSWDEVNGNGGDAVDVGGALILQADSTEWIGNGGVGLVASGSQSNLALYQCRVNDNFAGIDLSGYNSHLEADYTFIRDNWMNAVYMGSGSDLRMDNCLIGYNGGAGIQTGGSVDLNYMDIIHNGGYGISAAQFSTVDNSVVWFNGGVPQMVTSNTYAVSYTNVQGINALMTSTDFAWGDGCIGTDPVFEDDNGHLDPYSPCVDGGMPWEQDAHIPEGLGSSRADMGMYGGPANDYWGGQAPPDGSVVITNVFDIPNDQGGQLGIQFAASPFDFGGLGFNVTHYSVWRDLAVESDTIIEVNDGNWEQIGTVPAQGFAQYGYTAATLVNTYPGDPGCMTNFIVLAHTTDDNIYWVSDVAGACAVDNLAPAAPELEGMVLADAGETAIQLSWPAPAEEDYAYTEIESDAGFTAVLNADTVATDATVAFGMTYTYTVRHFDINGNASAPATLTLAATGGPDLIPLQPGWNLVSSDRFPMPSGVEAITASLAPGNLQVVTGFDGGVEFYDPNGLAFLNTMTDWSPGRGYWVRVAEADTLEIDGAALPADYLPELASGWNLVAYPNATAASPAVFFSDLIDEGALEFVTGFNGGAQFYDPQGLAFLNTLTGLYNGLGYWVKMNADFNPNGLVLGQTKAAPTPNFMLINGSLDQPHLAGQRLEVVDASGTTVAECPILPGGHIMTTALFGDDPATSGPEGLAEGSRLRFRIDGSFAAEDVSFEGGMSLKKLDLTFPSAPPAVSVYPNPASTELTVSGYFERDAALTLEVLDMTGRLVHRTSEGIRAGAWNVHLPLGKFVPGVYSVRVLRDGIPVSFNSWVRG